jgi:hypothetical protein
MKRIVKHQSSQQQAQIKTKPLQFVISKNGLANSLDVSTPIYVQRFLTTQSGTVFIFAKTKRNPMKRFSTTKY